MATSSNPTQNSEIGAPSPRSVAPAVEALMRKFEDRLQKSRASGHYLKIFDDAYSTVKQQLQLQKIKKAKDFVLYSFMHGGEKLYLVEYVEDGRGVMGIVIDKAIDTIRKMRRWEHVDNFVRFYFKEVGMGAEP